MDFTFVDGKTFKSSLLRYQEHLYRKKSTYGNHTFFICVEKCCPGRIKLEDDAIFVLVDHNHEPDAIEYLIMQFKNDLKAKIRESNLSPRECYDLIGRSPE